MTLAPSRLHTAWQANLLRAYGNYSEEMMEGCSKQAEYRAIVFALCYYHAAMLERKKFGVGNLPASTSGWYCSSCSCLCFAVTCCLEMGVM